MARDTKDNDPSTFGARQNLRTSGEDELEKSTSILKKSDLSVVFIGAGIITVIVFLLFFMTGRDKASDAIASRAEIQSLESRIASLETLVAGLEKKAETPAGLAPSLESYRARVERVEAALSMKFDAVATRLSVLEKRMDGFGRRLDTQVQTHVPPKASTVQPPPVKKAVAKPAPQKAPAAAVVHRVKKGETLYSISRQYNTTVAKLRTLNRLTDTAAIFPGDDLVVK